MTMLEAELAMILKTKATTIELIIIAKWEHGNLTAAKCEPNQQPVGNWGKKAGIWTEK